MVKVPKNVKKVRIILMSISLATLSRISLFKQQIEFGFRTNFELLDLFLYKDKVILWTGKLLKIRSPLTLIIPGSRY